MKNLFLCVFLFSSFRSINAQDWAQLDRYKEANTHLSEPKPGEKRVVFMGNSITEGWQQPELTFFSKKGYINRGIGGQTTGQMKIRFWQDVIALHPEIVMILGGINDIAQNTGYYIPNDEIAANIADMAELAKAYRIQVVICSVLPANIFPWRPHILPADSVIALNKLLKAYAEKNDFIYLDYYSEMVNDQKGLRSIYTYDGVHCTLEGYRKMEQIASNVLNGLTD